MEEKTSVEPIKETKEAIETIVENLLEPKVSANETKEYERYAPPLPPLFHVVFSLWVWGWC
jgi:predicted PurR-regulated permease PerM